MCSEKKNLFCFDFRRLPSCDMALSQLHLATVTVVFHYRAVVMLWLSTETLKIPFHCFGLHFALVLPKMFQNPYPNQVNRSFVIDLNGVSLHSLAFTLQLLSKPKC